MSSVWQKTLLYLGLVDEDELTDAPQGSQPTPAGPQPAPQRPASAPITQQHAQPAPAIPDQRSGRRIEPPPPSRRRPVSDQPSIQSESGVVVRPGDYSGPTASRAEIVEAQAIGDAKQLADFIRARVPVIVNLRETEPDMVRRLVDFASGLVYALDGTMKKVAEGVILVSPPRVVLSPEEERRLADLGMYDPS